jgi:steroid 5-alpha reductase family enzyme
MSGEKCFFSRDKFSGGWVIDGTSSVKPMPTPAANPTKKTSAQPPRDDPGLTSPARRGLGRPKKDTSAADTSSKPKATFHKDSSRPVSPRSVRASQRDVEVWQSWPSDKKEEVQAKASSGAAHTSHTPALKPAAQPTPPKASVTAAGVAPPPPEEPLMSIHVRMVPRLSLLNNTLNAILMVLVAVPAVLFGLAVCSGDGAKLSPQLASIPILNLRLKELISLDWWLALGHYSPLVAVNAVLFFNVDVLFYLIYLLTGSTWLIDPWWTGIPPLISLFILNHPLASASIRSKVVMGLIRVWSIRLTWSYFRREEWQFGAREDWRFTEMSKMLGPRIWPFACFFAAYVSQHLLFFGNCYPLYFVATIDAPWSQMDFIATLLAIVGLLIASFADASLQSFKVHNEKRKAYGLAPIPVLDKGLWGWSRHPNHLGEQLFWWAVGLFAYRLGKPWALGGAAFNTLVMVTVTLMVEAKMSSVGSRGEAWKAYCKRVPCWIGVPRSRRVD